MVVAEQPRPRRMRADARRNQERLLAAADAAFAARGTDASLEEIARAAGVANGTLYGHFPTRQALLEALLRERMDALAGRAAELAAGTEPFEGLRRWIDAAVDHATRYRGLSAACLRALEDETSELYAACHALLGAAGQLVARTRAAGELRADVTERDVFTLVSAVAWAVGEGTRDQADRLLASALAGMRAAGTAGNRPESR
ncbi:TetR/AcrR family transcriptional regulator [Streptomyces avicenniae]|uniref:TetR/AcrR family transcriptional regulator n=1 Tax=Streptomyces avicenniae TaxID=500153 RepID=UPI00069A3C2B|nr:TetR/AcrR family transcriptional regulator [Streptomyces avicenniae]